MEDDISAQMAAAVFVDAEPDAEHDMVTLGVALHPRGSNGSGATSVQTAAVQAVLADKMGDAPLCDTCGHITVRNGSCYRCLNCGDSKGCS
jgi:tRNA(Ile2) C34 agmatinyltransferase TiaS